MPFILPGRAKRRAANAYGRIEGCIGMVSSFCGVKYPHLGAADMAAGGSGRPEVLRRLSPGKRLQKTLAPTRKTRHASGAYEVTANSSRSAPRQR
ncbi:MAG: hypothetical protein COT71_01570 [Candidatus Andersenbacteria bacterium CG10_big_fil_rev_8_21_14_0_10_54_11]|uniref:Uncharacterized protein n=1 Tax=Candidatus Andersenbacteria bacterium CG10_big_fil_rev_8_21_14_0_10_54_11 TaxID=1974485 RepID=A0A2M6WZS8_9BACT|nr:MAG: hypothetical protein COT71_01570 [Candidatus Andersenbacteria bacterium CG10_big_fil_rev_8_21_14_0_10_54_11]